MTSQDTQQASEQVTYTDFEIAHAINEFNFLSVDYSQFSRRCLDRKGSVQDALTQMNNLHGMLIQRAALLSKMGVSFDANGRIKGIRVDMKGLFVGFDITNT